MGRQPSGADRPGLPPSVEGQAPLAEARQVRPPGAPTDTVEALALAPSQRALPDHRDLHAATDRLVDEHTREPYFAVEVVPGPQVDLAMRSAGVDVKPGMQAEVIVRMGERTLFNYLTKPLVERLVSAFKEE